MKTRSIAAALLLPICMVGEMEAQTAAPGSRDVEIRELRRELDRISARLAALEAETPGAAANAMPVNAGPAPAVAPPAPAVAAPVEPAPVVATATQPQPATPGLAPPDERTLRFFRGTRFALGVDGYYDYNFNAPVGRVNLLRAYDVTSNSFSLNQVSLIAEHLPTPQERVGGRIDLQFGQATETLQGSGVNEQRPQVWRNLYQAYGSYLAPVGSGLQLDFGKFASSLGNEGNYTKDQVAYSRAYSFNYLPFYHMGLRANYAFTPRVGLTYWLVNGANDTEDLNGFKSQAFLFALKPVSSVVWNVNYYFGQEARDVEPTLNPGPPTQPTQPGLPTANILPAPNGREHIFDTYATWTATKKLTLVGEADYVLNRTYAEQQPGRVVIGSLTGRYALPASWSVGARAEYFDDRGGLFSGKTQALKEATAVLDHLMAPGFLLKLEYRRDWSNQDIFLSDRAGVLKPAQTTATVGLTYWWGTKDGNW